MGKKNKTEEPWADQTDPNAGPPPENEENAGVEQEPPSDPPAEETLNIETNETKETLKVQLTDEDYKTLAIKIGQASTEISRAEDELAAVKSQFKSRIDAAVAKRNQYASIINAGCEYKPVDCHLIKNYQENTVTLVRLDTQEVVRVRAMTADERQRGLDYGP